nr:type II toxin-antitoxin system Phd/YefM family antitoxin [Enterobacter hormaechei]
MKTITYTQMRSDLSATLELLRSGERITVTQQGKPDVVISAKLADQAVPAKTMSPVRGDLNLQLAKLLASNLSPEAKEEVMNLTRQLHNLLHSDETKQTIATVADAAARIKMGSESFIQALQHTQTKHAEIIKKLEDK